MAWKTEISPCCDAPSTNMTRIKSVKASDGQRRCVRCTNVFSCWIQVDDDQEEIMRIRGVGAHTGQKMEKSFEGNSPMKEIIYLVVDQRGVQNMRKTLPEVRRGEIPVKLTINVPPEAFSATLSQEITVNDWRPGIELSDVEFKHDIIKPEEAEVIRQRRLEKMRSILEGQASR
jgi:hypothetical protein